VSNIAVTDEDYIAELKNDIFENFKNGKWSIEKRQFGDYVQTNDLVYRQREFWTLGDLSEDEVKRFSENNILIGGRKEYSRTRFKLDFGDSDALRLIHLMILSVSLDDRQQYFGEMIEDYYAFVEKKHKVSRYLRVAAGVSAGSKCQKANHGCIIVSKYDTIVGTGFNFHPRNTNKDSICKRKHIPSGTNTHIGYCCHAEVNALISSNPIERQGGTLYVTAAPCNMCALYVMQSGVDYIVYPEKEFVTYKGASMFHELGSSVVPISIPFERINNGN